MLGGIGFPHISAKRPMYSRQVTGCSPEIKNASPAAAGCCHAVIIASTTSSTHTRFANPAPPSISVICSFFVRSKYETTQYGDRGP